MALEPSLGHLTDQPRITDTATTLDELIIRSLQGRAAGEELRRLRQWRNWSTKNERTYQDLASAWRLTSHYENPVRASPPAAADIVEAAESSDQNRVGARGTAIPRWLRHGTLAAAAMGAIALGYGAADWFGQAEAPVNSSEVVTGEGQTSTAHLADGTVVRLAPESRLRLNPEGRSREVVLEGRAFFAVASDPDAPFLVRGPGGEARVLGTRFEMTTRGEEMRLVVVEGLVSVGSGSFEQRISANQVSHSRKGGEPSIIEVDDVWEVIGWMDQFLAFESTPMRDVREELKRRFNVTLQFEDPELAEETVTVWFGDEPWDQVVSVLCRLIRAECSQEGATVKMSKMNG